MKTEICSVKYLLFFGKCRAKLKMLHLGSSISKLDLAQPSATYTRMLDSTVANLTGSIVADNLYWYILL